MKSREPKATRKGGRAPTRAERVAAGMISVEVWFAPEDGLDEKRGDLPRGTYLRQLVQRAKVRP